MTSSQPAHELPHSFVASVARRLWFVNGGIVWTNPPHYAIIRGIKMCIRDSTGDMLTTSGNRISEDQEMLAAMGFTL